MELKAYMYLIDGYLHGELSADDFQTIYMATFAKEHDNMDRALFVILQDLFEDVDAFSVLWTEEDENEFRLTEPSLRREVVDASEKLEAYQRQRSP
jgi:hypothetical protein